MARHKGDMTQNTVPRHQWTHDGTEVLIVKWVGKDGETYKGFRWPLQIGACVESPNWSAEPTCESGGLFGWAWGFAIGDGKEPDWSATWLVFGASPSDVVQLSGGKVKAQRGVVRYIGDWQGATTYVLGGQIAWVAHGSRGAASATGWRGAASATGERGAASATGWSGAASATGESGAASATGGSGAASATGESSLAAVTGLDGRVCGGPYSVLALAWWDTATNRREMRCARIGCGDGTDGQLKAHQWYRLDAAGTFTEESVAHA